MKKIQSPWINHIIHYIREYTRLAPGYSPLILSEALQSKFMLSKEDAVTLSDMVEKEISRAKPGLVAIELNLTFNCNLTCDYCFVHRKSPHERMSLTTAKKAIDLLVERAVFPNIDVIFFGGEPLLEFELIKQIVPYLLEEAEKRNLQVYLAITTNGTLINEEILKYLEEHHINMLLSIDGGPDTHDRYRKTRIGEGTWHKIAGLIPLVKKYQPWLRARMTVSTEAIGSMREDFKQLVDLGVNELIIAPAQGAQIWTMKQIEEYGINLVKILDNYHQLKQQGHPIFVEEFEENEDESEGWGCRAGNTSLAVAPNGDLSPCSKLLGLTDEAGRLIIGNVNTNINFKLLEPFQNAINHQPGHCRTCFRKCSGGCYAVNFEQTGDHFLPSEENCLIWVIRQEIQSISKKMSGIGMTCSGCMDNICSNQVE